ncbi:lantibiotic dehydratase [Pedobacter sp. SYP-B3415]|uniref:lantibiotic dehydratase n=1 Tax=Pedobacter sp. SYP-B3415 TaxID=2496641 RepID=UPI00101BE770|nr:lantibiotic dehydratase [Pedobacter sp. SYP-B3415]
MSGYFFETAMCRTPAFVMTAAPDISWNTLKGMIAGASPAFYEQIAGVSYAGLEALPPRVGFTVWKYFNRARYRATPFGAFAAVSLVPLVRETEAAIILTSEPQLRSFTDWSEKQFIDPAAMPGPAEDVLLMSNPGIYRLGSEIRYIRFDENQFELASVQGFPELEAVLFLCRRPRSFRSLAEVMAAEFDMVQADMRTLLDELLSRQLLLTDRWPNITGPDYFGRLNYRSRQSLKYEIACRQTIGGNLTERRLNVLKEWADFVASNLTQHEHPALEHFKGEFLNRFESAEVPLSVALDPEVGIGYGQHAAVAGIAGLAQSLRQEETDTVGTHDITYTALHRFLLNNMLHGADIRLENFKTVAPDKKAIPNTLAVLVHFSEDKLVLGSQAGGVATALHGRFTLAGDAYEQLARDLASVEMRANPDVIFFDIAYQAEQQIDNVNRRRAVYSHELPVLSWSCADNIISFDEILVSVRGDEIILRSERAGKRLVPRLASAYNYTRSDLDLYRFLCDLQHQGLCADLGFRPADYLPGLDHYPRVYYKTLVVSEAMWKVPGSLFPAKGRTNDLLQLKGWLSEKGICGKFKTGTGDMTLVFDTESDQDLHMFLQYLGHDKPAEVYVAEALLPDDGHVVDEAGQPYAAKFVVSLCHGKRIYADYPDVTKGVSHFKDVQLPGSEWLYFSIYCHPSRSNALLQYELSDILEQFRICIHRWFFIRYQEPRPHLRLRLLLKDRRHATEIIQAMQVALEPYTQLGIVGDFTLNTYFRETFRYGAGRIIDVERFFHEDSAGILQVLMRNPNETQLHQHAMEVIKKIFLPFAGSITARIRFVSRMAAAFANEMKFDTGSFRELNRISRETHGSTPALVGMGKLSRQLALIMQTCKSPREKNQMLSDLIHMHINRLFSSDQRMHEAIIYQYLLKALQTEHARAKKAEER